MYRQDMKKWLDDTPKFPEYSSGNSSSGEKVTAEEFETLSESVEEEYRKQGRGKGESPTKCPKKNKSMQHKKKGLLILASKGRLPAESKEERELLMKRKKKKMKKDKLMDSLFETPCDKTEKEPPPQPMPPVENGKNPTAAVKVEKERPAARKAFDRLQPGGKSKLSKVSRPDESKLSSVIAKIKESRSSALQKQTETIQKAQLSLGTVLLSEIGSNKSEEAAGQVAEQQQQVAKPSESPQSTPAAAATGSSSEDGAPSSQVAAAEPKSAEPAVEVVKHSTATPNLSAWFKAFGAPKNPIKRQMSETQETTSRAQPPAKKGIGQQDGGNKDLPWYARLEKKESVAPPPIGRLEPVVSSVKEVETDGPAEESGSRHLMDPCSPADSLGSVHSPASAESIRSPSTPGGWGGRNYPAANDPPIRSPLTPETGQSFSPSVLHPIKVGFYQDMQALKGASPSHVKSPSCHSNSSSGGTGPNSPCNDLHVAPPPAPIQQPSEQPARTAAPPGVGLDSHHHHHLQQHQHQPLPVPIQHPHHHHQHQQQQTAAFQAAETSHRLAAAEAEKQAESYPLKKRSTVPAMAQSSPSIVTPTPIHASARPQVHDPRSSMMNQQQQQQSNFASNFSPADYSGAAAARHPSVHHHQHAQQQQQEQQPGQYGQYSSHYGQNVAANPLPGNLASLSQIVARIPAGGATAAASAPSNHPEMSQQPQVNPHHQHPKRSHAQQQQQPFPTTTNMGYSYPSQSVSSVSSASSLVAASPAYSGSQMTPATSVSTSSSRAPSAASSSQNNTPSSHMMTYNNAAAAAAAAAYTNQPAGVFYPPQTSNPAYRNQPQATNQQPQQQQQQHHQQQQQQQQGPQQQQQPQSRPSQVSFSHHGAAAAGLASFEVPGNHNFMWNTRPAVEQVGGNAQSAATTPNPVAAAYGRSASGSNPFPSSLGYDPHHHHHHMGGSLLFSGLDPLGGNASGMFARNPLSRPTPPPWAAPLSLDNNMPPAGRSQQQQQQQQHQANNNNTSAATQPRNSKSSRSAESTPATAPGSAFNYNLQGLGPSTAGGGVVPGGNNDALSAAYERHRGQSQSLAPSSSSSSLPPPAHQGSSISAHHQYAAAAAAAAAAAGNHHFGPPGAGGLNAMSPAFGEFQPPPPPHPHHPLAEHAQSSALYQQLLQQHRQQQEELLLRNPHHPAASMMLAHQPGLLGSPAAYPPTFSSGLGLQQPFQGWL